MDNKQILTLLFLIVTVVTLVLWILFPIYKYNIFIPLSGNIIQVILLRIKSFIE